MKTSTLLLQIFYNEGAIELCQFGKWLDVLIKHDLLEITGTKIQLTDKARQKFNSGG